MDEQPQKPAVQTQLERNRQRREFIEQRTGVPWTAECLSEERDGILNYTHHYAYSGNDEAATHLKTDAMDPDMAENIYNLFARLSPKNAPRLDKKNGTLWLNIARAGELMQDENFKQATAGQTLLEQCGGWTATRANETPPTRQR